MFGLTNRSVVAAIERLSGVENCKGYIPTTFEEVPAEGNAQSEQGIAQSEGVININPSLGNSQIEMGNSQIEMGNFQIGTSIPQGDGQLDESDFDMEDELEEMIEEEEEEVMRAEEEESSLLSESILVESDEESAIGSKRKKRTPKPRSDLKQGTKLRVRCRVTPDGYEAEDTLMYSIFFSLNQ